MRYEDSFNSIVGRFRSGRYDFGEIERSVLRNVILNEPEGVDLQSAIQIYSYLFPAEKEIILKCKKYTVENMVPGISAVCFKALFRYWCVYEDIYINSIRKFLHTELWDEFYDEIYFLIRFLTGGDGRRFEGMFQKNILELREWAQDNHVEELLDAWND